MNPKLTKPELEQRVLCNAKKDRAASKLINVLDCSTLFVLICHILTDMVRVIVDNMEKDLKGNKKLKICFELGMVRVTKAKLQ